jgi:septal ring factor EnvC (AmiA/AmiB activator)
MWSSFTCWQNAGSTSELSFGPFLFPYSGSICPPFAALQAILQQEQAEKADFSERARGLQDQLDEARNDLKDEQESASALGEQLIDVSRDLESSRKDYELAANRAASLRKGVLRRCLFGPCNIQKRKRCLGFIHTSVASGGEQTQRPCNCEVFVVR